MRNSGESRACKAASILITGLSLFIGERKAEVRQQHPELTRLELRALLNDEWWKLDDGARAGFTRKADYCRRIECRRQNRMSRSKGNQKSPHMQLLSDISTGY
jgi:hypothetical protein